MFICESWLFDTYFPQFCTSNMSKYGYLEVFQRVLLASRYRESNIHVLLLFQNIFAQKIMSVASCLLSC